MKKPLWTPNPDKSEQSQMMEFIKSINQKYGKNFKHYEQLHRWSVENIKDFWKEIWQFSHIKHSREFESVLDYSGQMLGNRWFKGANLNFAENLLSKKDDKIALIFKGEAAVEKKISYKELYEQVKQLAVALKKTGLKKGDRAAAFMPNMPETIIAMLACASIGVIWSSTSPDFGIKGVLDRFKQIQPKIIFAADGYFYKNRKFDTQENVKGILRELPSVERVVMTDYIGSLDCSSIPQSVAWKDFLKPTNKELQFEQLPFHHPLYILYSSGTTGLPKSMVHSAGGTLLQHIKEHRLHCNLTEEDVIFYFTTCGWMMWNWLVTALATGSTLVLYDGNPFYPHPDALLKMIDEYKINIFGTSAKYISFLDSEGIVPRDISGFPSLKAILSTGSPLSEQSFRYVYEKWKTDVQLSSIAGGTDIVSCFVLGNPILPVYEGEIQCKGLGMDVDCFDEKGHSLINEEGELVCKKPFPSMPVYFWNDENDKKYKNAYFSSYEDVWTHGDYIVVTETQGIIMLGRSDATLNPAGVRIGTAELYRVVEAMDEILDSVVVGKKTQNTDEEIVLFVKLNENLSLDDELVKKIKTNIRQQCSPRHVPAYIHSVPDIPYTINGKKIEIAVKQILHGKKVRNKAAIANPECLQCFERYS